MILAFGKLTDVMTGPCGTMLNQAGYNKLALYDNLAALVLNVGLNFALIPTYGLRGSSGLDGVAGPRQRSARLPGPAIHHAGLALQRGDAQGDGGVRLVGAGRLVVRAGRRLAAQGALHRDTGGVQRLRDLPRVARTHR